MFNRGVGSLSNSNPAKQRGVKNIVVNCSSSILSRNRGNNSGTTNTQIKDMKERIDRLNELLGNDANISRAKQFIASVITFVKIVIMDYYQLLYQRDHHQMIQTKIRIKIKQQ